MEKAKASLHPLPVFLLAAALIMIMLAAWFQLSGRGADASTLEGRTQFLAELGWTIDPDSEEQKSVLIPDCSEGVMADYNALQRREGYDLSEYEGKTCTQYSYRLLDYPGYDQTVYVTLYVSGRRVIGGDVHSAALNGFLHGLQRDPSA